MDGWMGLDRLRRRKGERERKEEGRRGLARRVESGVFELNLSVLQHPQRIKRNSSRITSEPNYHHRPSPLPSAPSTQRLHLSLALLLPNLDLSSTSSLPIPSSLPPLLPLLPLFSFALPVNLPLPSLLNLDQSSSGASLLDDLRTSLIADVDVDVALRLPGFFGRRLLDFRVGGGSLLVCFEGREEEEEEEGNRKGKGRGQSRTVERTRNKKVEEERIENQKLTFESFRATLLL
ncbi:hypothetical protein BDY24DRAFT_400884 [Mrakia frigida]|uniref:uncharacterized protein n=1 Tax=Mrakia frigida TaxID=29902 RepID=UPI003FCC2061